MRRELRSLSYFSVALAMASALELAMALILAIPDLAHARSCGGLHLQESPRAFPPFSRKIDFHEISNLIDDLRNLEGYDVRALRADSSTGTDLYILVGSDGSANSSVGIRLLRNLKAQSHIVYFQKAQPVLEAPVDGLLMRLSSIPRSLLLKKSTRDRIFKPLDLKPEEWQAIPTVALDADFDKDPDYKKAERLAMVFNFAGWVAGPAMLFLSQHTADFKYVAEAAGVLFVSLGTWSSAQAVFGKDLDQALKPGRLKSFLLYLYQRVVEQRNSVIVQDLERHRLESQRADSTVTSDEIGSPRVHVILLNRLHVDGVFKGLEGQGFSEDFFQEPL